VSSIFDLENGFSPLLYPTQCLPHGFIPHPFLSVWSYSSAAGLLGRRFSQEIFRRRLPCAAHVDLDATHRRQTQSSRHWTRSNSTSVRLGDFSFRRFPHRCRTEVLSSVGDLWLQRSTCGTALRVLLKGVYSRKPESSGRYTFSEFGHGVPSYLLRGSNNSTG